MFLLFCFLVLISAENKRKREGGRVKLSGFYSANVYHFQSQVKVLFAQEKSCYLYTKTLHPHHIMGFHVGIHLCDEIPLLTNPALSHGGHFSFCINLGVCYLAFVHQSYAFFLQWFQQHYSLFLHQPLPR